MMKRTVFGHFALSATLFSVICAGSAIAGNGSEPVGFTPFTEVQGVREFTGQMIIRPLQPEQGVDRGLNSAEIATLRDAAVKRIYDTADVIEYVWQTDEYIVRLREGVTENQLAEQLTNTGEYDYVQPNWMYYPTVIPNDSRINSQWHHKADRVNSYAAWDTYTGDPSVSVGLCDTGVRTTHEDLLLHRLEGYNAVNHRWENDGGQISDINGHGTWVTGTACANGNNGKGVSGMGWDLSHRMLRVTNSGGGGAYLTDLTHAARTSIDAGDRCASVSYGGATDGSARTTASYCKSNGGLLFWAAGNEGRRLSGSRDGDDLLVIGATTSSDYKASFSNYGPYVDFMAPGANIYTTDRTSNSSYGSVSGTSFSCPMAAGLGALIWSTDPSLSPDQVENAMKSTCTDLGTSGVDDTYGYGRIDAADAIASIAIYKLTVVPEPPVYGGSNVHFVAKNGDANKLTALFYSLAGYGRTEVAPGIFIDLKTPKQVGGTKTSNINGDTDWGAKIPNSSLRVFMQAVQATARSTDVIYFDIQ